MIICLTGHRPHKLFGYDKSNKYNKEIVNEVIQTIKALVEDFRENEDETVTLHDGMALGIDMWVAEAFLKEYRNDVRYRLECDIPFINQSAGFKSMGDKMLWNRITQNATKVNYVSDKGYTKSCLNDRNKYMVDSLIKDRKSNEKTLVISVWDGSQSGTKNCIKYALLKGHQVYNINPQKVKDKVDKKHLELVYEEIPKNLV